MYLFQGMDQVEFGSDTGIQSGSARRQVTDLPILRRETGDRYC